MESDSENLKVLVFLFVEVFGERSADEIFRLWPEDKVLGDYDRPSPETIGEWLEERMEA